MNTDSDYLKLYKIRRLTCIAGAATASSVLLFLYGQSLTHLNPTQEPPAIDQMMGYLEFFGFAAANYFMSALLAWKCRKSLQKRIVPWVVIAGGGSVMFSATFAFYIYLQTYLFPQNGPFAPEPIRFMFILTSVAAWSVLLFLISGPISTIASAIYTYIDDSHHNLRLVDGNNQVEKTSPKA